LLKVFLPAGSYVNLWNYQDVLAVDVAKQVEIAVSNDHLSIYLPPGAIAVRQLNSEKKLKTTADFLSKAKTTLVANRDDNKQATGELFLDDGSSYTSIGLLEFDYYQFQLQANTLHRWIQNDGVGTGVFFDTPNKFLEQLVIVNAEDMATYDFACAVNNEKAGSVPVQLDIAY